MAAECSGVLEPIPLKTTELNHPNNKNKAKTKPKQQQKQGAQQQEFVASRCYMHSLTIHLHNGERTPGPQ
jgi:hypothetical protein